MVGLRSGELLQLACTPPPPPAAAATEAAISAAAVRIRAALSLHAPDPPEAAHASHTAAGVRYQG